jgi:hypothetical protein
MIFCRNELQQEEFLQAMVNRSKVRVGYDRYIAEFFFSLNLGLGIVVVKSVSSFWIESRLKNKINAFLSLHPHSNTGGYIALFGLAFGIAFLIFLVLRLSSFLSSTSGFLNSAGGIAALVAQPAAWLYFIQLGGYDPEPFAVNFLLLSEMGVAAACALLYLYSKWPLSAWPSVVLLGFHFEFWYWLFVGRSFIFPAIKLVFPLVAFCSFLTWVHFVSRPIANPPAPRNRTPKEFGG